MELALKVLTTIALWCGDVKGIGRAQSEITACREKLLVCINPAQDRPFQDSYQNVMKCALKFGMWK